MESSTSLSKLHLEITTSARDVNVGLSSPSPPSSGNERSDGAGSPADDDPLFLQEENVNLEDLHWDDDEEEIVDEADNEGEESDVSGGEEEAAEDSEKSEKVAEDRENARVQAAQEPKEAAPNSAPVDESLAAQLLLEHTWVFWYDGKLPKGMTNDDYNASIKNLGKVSNVRDFWRYWNHLPIHRFPEGANLRLFKVGIKPMWEDPQNLRGGKWSVFVSKHSTAEQWQKLALALIGEQFEHSESICGAVLSTRHGGNTLHLWNNSGEDSNAIDTTTKQLKQILGCSGLKYQLHKPALELNKTNSSRSLHRVPSLSGRKDMPSSSPALSEGSIPPHHRRTQSQPVNQTPFSSPRNLSPWGRRPSDGGIGSNGEPGGRLSPNRDAGYAPSYSSPMMSYTSSYGRSSNSPSTHVRHPSSESGEARKSSNHSVSSALPPLPPKDRSNAPASSFFPSGSSSAPSSPARRAWQKPHAFLNASAQKVGKDSPLEDEEVSPVSDLDTLRADFQSLRELATPAPQACDEPSPSAKASSSPSPLSSSAPSSASSSDTSSESSSSPSSATTSVSIASVSSAESVIPAIKLPESISPSEGEDSSGSSSRSSSADSVPPSGSSPSSSDSDLSVSSSLSSGLSNDSLRYSSPLREDVSTSSTSPPSEDVPQDKAQDNEGEEQETEELNDAKLPLRKSKVKSQKLGRATAASPKTASSKKARAKKKEVGAGGDSGEEYMYVGMGLATVFALLYFYYNSMLAPTWGAAA